MIFHASFLRLAGLSGIVATLSCAAPASPGALTPESRGALRDVPASLTAPLPLAATRWIDSTLASLSLRDRVAQMMMIWVLGDYTSTTDSSFVWASDRIALDHVGGVVMSLGSPIEVAAKVNAMQQQSRIPLLVASDVEPGLGRLEGGTFLPNLLRGGDATVLPSNMAIGASGSVRHAQAAGRIIGLESRAIGIHVAFAPAVDINNNPANPVINVRSFGEEPNAVARLGAAFVLGLQETGVAATLKHFPGHGDTDTDSHNALPIVSASRERLDQMELVPFRAALAAGAAAVMSAHIALPAISRDSTPATLVPAIMHGLLRDTLGFRGLAFTDAMDMRGVGAGYGLDESSVRAVLAGNDVLLMPADIPAAISAVTAAVERGEIPAARIEASVRRILEYKIRTGAIQRPFVSLDSLRTVVGTAAHRAIAQAIANDAVTLLRNDDGQIPFAPRGRTAVITFTSDADLSAGRTFGAELRTLLPETRLLRITPGTPRARLDSLLRPDERVVFATFVRTIEGEGRFAVGAHVARWVDSVAIARPLTVVAFSNPYVVREFGWVSGYIATYGRGDATERAAAQALAGRIPFHGRAPISLPGFYSAGDGAPRDTVAQATLEDSLRTILTRGVRDSVFPGAIAVIGDRRGILTQVSAGRIDWAADAPTPDLNTVWDIASLTKVVGMTTAMMQLVEQGHVDLDAPVQRYLPEWTGPHKERVTVRHLLTHSAGLPAFRQLWKLTPNADSARALLLNTPLDTVPGARMVYSDIGAVLLGFVVERVAREPLDRYLDQRVFAPLGLRDTRYAPPNAWRSRIAPTEQDPWRGRLLRGEVHDENAAFLGTPVAHAGLFSSASDLARFARMLLNEGVLDGVRLIGTATVRDFTRVQNVLVSNRALGWETPTGTNSAGRVMRRPAYGHTGFTGTSIWIDPTTDRFVILLTNRVNPTRENSRIGPLRTAVADLVTTRAISERNAIHRAP